MLLSWVKEQLDYKNGGSSYSLTEDKKKHTSLGFWLKKNKKGFIFRGKCIIEMSTARFLRRLSGLFFQISQIPSNNSTRLLV